MYPPRRRRPAAAACKPPAAAPHLRRRAVVRTQADTHVSASQRRPLAAVCKPRCRPALREARRGRHAGGHPCIRLTAAACRCSLQSPLPPRTQGGAPWSARRRTPMYSPRWRRAGAALCKRCCRPALREARGGRQAGGHPCIRLTAAAWGCSLQSPLPPSTWGGARWSAGRRTPMYSPHSGGLGLQPASPAAAQHLGRRAVVGSQADTHVFATPTAAWGCSLQALLPPHTQGGPRWSARRRTPMYSPRRWRPGAAAC